MSTQATTRPSPPARSDAGPAVEVVDLVKRYGRSGRPAVDGLGFAVRRGEVFGLLGPNGAGKTTTVGVLTTRVTPTSGHATVAGIDVATDPVAARAVLGVVPQRPNLDRSQATTSPDELSGGQAQRLIIARGLMHDPQVLFLDEPSTGLDPQARLFVHDRVADLAASGVTIVLTTHDMDEAAKLADRVGIVDHGKLLALDSPSALVAALPGEATIDLVLTGADAATVRGRVGELRGVAGVDDRTGETDETVRLRVRCDGEAGAALPPVLGAVAATGATVHQVELGEPTLEDVFIDLTGRGLR
ncbi:MAG: bacteriocin transporter ATP-binding protein [Actinomycetospora sp.]|nr:bacteriocin transporter ATP-binding protein [Actinomycetospora sp.]